MFLLTFPTKSIARYTYLLSMAVSTRLSFFTSTKPKSSPSSYIQDNTPSATPSGTIFLVFSRLMTPRGGTRCLYFPCNALLCLVLTMFIFWLIFLPKEPQFTVSNASLTRFNFTDTDNTLDYNLALNITIRNPNKRVGIYYRRIQVFANYRKKRFANVTLPWAPFYQGHENTTILNHVLVEGQQLAVFGERDLSQFNSETAAGVYSIDVKISLRVRARFGKIKTPDYGPSNINCNLKVPLSLSETLPSGFNATKCRNVHVLTNPSDWPRI